ncbi:hypothetical protein [Tenacibaculum sp. nBUS_03]|uniref:hypothetical protein n=1 Tax=Tenacibaculum sp. nBUS_03 TaxID=3395320 RepID=UPI003EB6BE63
MRKWIKKYKDKKELKKSNWGREYGWHIEYKGIIIGELINCEWMDMFWDTYIIKARDEKWNKILTEPIYWDNFKFKNQHYNQYAIYGFPGGGYEAEIKLNKRISMRGLYLTEIKTIHNKT